MPRFAFRETATHNLIFGGALECRKCAFTKPDGQRCKRTSCKQLPYCYQHVRNVYGVEIKPSGIQGAGTGLFAVKEFKRGDWIAPVLGESLTQAQLDNRYAGAPGATMPYVISPDSRTNYDGALMRFSGQYANSLFNAQMHRSKKAGTNADFGVHRVDGQRQPWIRATKTIQRGTEILAYYGSDYRLQDTYSASTY